jgi:hypothetical protein
MKWSVSITLCRDRLFFETEMRLYNRTALPHRYWIWANSFAPVSKGTQYITTAGKVSDPNAILDFRVHNGVDISWDSSSALNTVRGSRLATVSFLHDLVGTSILECPMASFRREVANVTFHDPQANTVR